MQIANSFSLWWPTAQLTILHHRRIAEWIFRQCRLLRFLVFAEGHTRLCPKRSEDVGTVAVY